MNVAKIFGLTGPRSWAGNVVLLLTALMWQGCAEPRPPHSHAAIAPPAPPPAVPAAPAAPAAAAVPALPATPPKAPESVAFPAGVWKNLFDGETLKGWAVTDFAGHGEVKVDGGKIILGSGVMTGITWTNDLPRMNYEVELEAMRVEGSDFFCGLTFPVGPAPCSFIVGGWGGGVVGLSSLDGEDAANNETTKYMNFEKGRWYKVRLQVTPTAIQAWIDQEKMVDIVTTDRAISIRLEVELSRPLGISSWSTTAALRNLRMRAL